MGISASRRLRKRRDFLQVRASGIRVAMAPFVLQCFHAAAAGNTPSRLGIIATRRVGNAVKRNRGKRIFRELFRIHASSLPPDCDCVIVLRSNFDQYSFDKLRANYLRACALAVQKLKLD